MPLVRIDLNTNSSTKLRKTISEVVCSAITGVANLPEHDKFQIFTLHESDELGYPHEGYLDIDYAQDIILFGFRAAQRIRRRLSSEDFVMICRPELALEKRTFGLSLPTPTAQTDHLETAKCS